jgi:hypothetical protein
MIETLPAEEITHNATRTGEAVAACLWYVFDLVADQDEVTHDELEQVIRQTTGIRFVKPNGPAIEALMSQFGVLFVQVVPTAPTSVLGQVLEQGYHVVPKAMLEDWKTVIRAKHSETVQAILEAIGDARTSELAEAEETAEVEAPSAGAVSPASEEV